MKPNKYLTEEQRQYIDNIKTGTDTKGINLGIAHDITVLENTIRHYVDSLLHQNGGIPRETQAHNDVAFENLKKLVKRRDELIEGCGVEI